MTKNVALLDGKPLAKKASEQAAESKQIAFRVPAELASEVEEVAARFGLDLSNFMRLMVKKCLPQMRREAQSFDKPWTATP